MSDKQDQERTEEREFIDVFGSDCACTWEAIDGDNRRMRRTASVDSCPEHPASPRVWSLPAEPGPEVTRLRGNDGTRLTRSGDSWLSWQGGAAVGLFHWSSLLDRFGPVTDASEPTPTALAASTLLREAQASVALDGETQSLDEEPTP